MKLTKEEFLNEIMTRREAQDYMGVTNQTMQYHLTRGNLKPCKTVPVGTTKETQLFWKRDIDEYLRLIR